MWRFPSRQCSLAHTLQTHIKQHLPHLISRGATIEKVSESHLLIQDIDEWLWTDGQRLENACAQQLIIHVYASVSQDADNLNGIVVSIQVLENSTLWGLVEKTSSFCVCVSLFLWIKYLYLVDSAQQIPEQ